MLAKNPAGMSASHDADVQKPTSSFQTVRRRMNCFALIESHFGRRHGARAMAVWCGEWGCVNEVAAVVVTYSFTCRVPFLEGGMRQDERPWGKHCIVVESLETGWR